MKKLSKQNNYAVKDDCFDSKKLLAIVLKTHTQLFSEDTRKKSKKTRTVHTLADLAFG